ncbi:MAG: hypothetical protein ACYDBJ_00710 [Aggregatilineales bacterium]
MRNPRLEDFDASANKHTPDKINMLGVVPLYPKPVERVVKQTTPEPNSPQATMTARQHDGMTASRRDSMVADRQATMTALAPTDIEAFLQEKATQKTTVRLPTNLLRKLEETLYLIKIRHNNRLSMNAIFVAALASFCAEFEEQGAESPLYKRLEKTRK